MSLVLMKTQMMNMVGHWVSGCSILFLALFKTVAIVAPIWYQQKVCRRHINVAVAGCWLFALGYTIRVWFIPVYFDEVAYTLITENTRYSVFIGVAAFGTVCCLHVTILIAVARQKWKMRHTVAGLNPPQNPILKAFKMSKAELTLGAVYLCMVLPSLVILGTVQGPEVKFVCMWIIHCESIVNSLVYMAFKHEVLKGLKVALRCCKGTQVAPVEPPLPLQ